MEILLKIYDDADEWLQMAWLASGTVLWLLLTLLTTTILFAGSLWTPGLGWLVAAIGAIVVSMAPLLQNRLSL